MRLWVAFLFVAAAYAQPDCSVDGTVANSVTGAPVVRASVTANDREVVVTDDLGKWHFDHLPCGNANISATRQNFLSERLSNVIHLAAGTPLSGMKIQLAPQAVVTGRVVNEQGDPVQFAVVTGTVSRIIDGVRRFGIGTAFGNSNDIGEYRIAAMPAGRYVFCATGAHSNGTPNSSYGEQCSSPMTIPAGYNGTVNFQLPPLSVWHVRGTISGAPEGANLQLTLSGTSRTLATGVHPDGSFAFDSVSAGSYALTATAFQGDDRFVATVPVEVSGRDVDGVGVHLDKGLTIAGSVTVHAFTGTKIDNSKLSVGAFVARGAGTPIQAQWNEEKTSFTLSGVVPGRYRFQISAPSPFYVERATMGGQDIINSEIQIVPGVPEIEIVVSDNSGRIEGSVSGSDGPVAAAILIQLGDLRHWSAHADGNGHFQVEGIPPGDYKITAWDDLANVEFANPVWMQLNATSVSASVQPGQTTKVNLERKTAPNE